MTLENVWHYHSIDHPELSPKQLTGCGKRFVLFRFVYGFAPKIERSEKQKISPHHSQKSVFLLIKSHTFNKNIKKLKILICLYHLNDTRNSRVPGHVIRIVLYARWDW
jgi:hypothetical protein